MTNKFLTRLLLGLFVICYAVSLFLPGIVYKIKSDNAKYDACNALFLPDSSTVIRTTTICGTDTGNLVTASDMTSLDCVEGDMSGSVPPPLQIVDTAVVVHYCGTDWWTTPEYDYTYQTWYGWDVLGLGLPTNLFTNVASHPNYLEIILVLIYSIFATFIGMFTDPGALAWWANVLVAMALVIMTKSSSSAEAKRIALGSAFAAPFIGFLALFFFSPSTVEGPTLPPVDHLGSGYYLWEISLVILVLYCLVKYFISLPKQDPRS
jgi:hypothetical protein